MSSAFSQCLIKKSGYNVSASFDDIASNCDFRRAVDFVSEIEDMKRLFATLSECMAFVHEESERRLNSAQLRAGFASLPNEILSVVLAFASQNSSDESGGHRNRGKGRNSSKYEKQFLSAVSLSHVCRRFRLVLLSTPEFWNSFSDNMKPGAIQACLQRSGGMSLDILFTSFCNVQTHPQFYEEELLRVLIRSSYRWRNLTMKVAPLDVVKHRASFEELNVSQLTALSIYSPLKVPMEWVDAESRITVCHKWRVPRLQSLSVYQLIPPPFHHATSLGDLYIELGDQSHWQHGPSWTFDTDALGQFLQSFPALARLSMKVSGPQSVINTPNPWTFSLSNVEIVTLSFPFCRSAMIGHLVANIRFPAASTLNVDFGLGTNKGRSLTTRIAYMFNNRDIFPNVINLNLSVICTDGDYSPQGRAGKMEIPFSLLGQIRHFTFTVSSFEALPPTDGARIPPLRSLSLVKCTGLTRSWIFEVLKQLHNQGDLGSLENLSVNDCAVRRNFSLDCRTLSPEVILEKVGAEMRLLSNNYYSPTGFDYWSH